MNLDNSSLSDHTKEQSTWQEEDFIELQEYLSVERLRQQANQTDLSTVTYLELLVNLTEHSLGDIGFKLPNLKHLKLNNSIIPTIRDLGTSLKNLQVLWLNRCGLKDLDGIHALSSLRELYVAYNDIEDISSLAGLESLEVLDLEANRIDDLGQLMFLEDCPTLWSLTLLGNPCVASFQSDEQRATYPSSVKAYLSNLQYLDDESIAHIVPSSLQDSPEKESTEKSNTSLEFQEMEMLNNAIKYARVDEDESLSSNPQILIASDRFLTEAEKKKLVSSRPSTAHATSSNRHSSSRFSLFENRPQSARPKNKPARPMTALGAGMKTSSQSSSNSTATRRNVPQDEDHSSDLTYGCNQVFAGNIVSNLRVRKAKKIIEQPPVVSPSPRPFEDIYDFNGDMLEEVMAFKLDEQQKQSQINEEHLDVEAKFISEKFEQIPTQSIPIADDDIFPTHNDVDPQKMDDRTLEHRVRNGPRPPEDAPPTKKSRSKRPRPKYTSSKKSSSPSENVPPNASVEETPVDKWVNSTPQSTKSKQKTKLGTLKRLPSQERSRYLKLSM